MSKQFQLSLQPISRVKENPNMFDNFTNFFLGSEKYVISNDSYITPKLCVTQARKFFESLGNTCQLGIQYVGKEFKGIFEIKDNVVTALQNNEAAHNYTQHELNGTFYLYDNKKSQVCIQNLHKALNIFQQCTFEEVKNYTREDILNFINNKNDTQELIYPNNDEQFIQQFFQLGDCRVFKILNDITQATNSTVSEIVNTTVTTLLNSTTEQQEDQENNNDGYSLGVYIAGGSAVLGVISAIGYAGYKWYKSYADNKYISHESEIELGRNNSQYFCPFSTTDGSLLIGENLSEDKANGDVSESYVSFRGNSMEDITPIIGDSEG
ncbi:hypothetical protein [Rickettsia bellii]|uniref:Transmembrane protein n=1 Tax=Rickettsia bellii str. RML Mogi TaxID=1359194 RepID=A0A0F3QHZ2_RICBE|nr:hypothetical protein [Rickettsia bellii]KJV92200.1 hypothetical protein RBEMOGI_0825 [Rickettsia bellii str. RML Mogi]